MEKVGADSDIQKTAVGDMLQVSQGPKRARKQTAAGTQQQRAHRERHKNILELPGKQGAA